MSLDWCLTEIKDWETVCYYQRGDERALMGATEALIYYSMPIGYDDITEKNWREIYARIWMWERIYGPMRLAAPLQPENVKEHIGLRTNGGGVNNKNQIAGRQVFLRGLTRKLDDMVKAVDRMIETGGI